MKAIRKPLSILLLAGALLLVGAAPAAGVGSASAEFAAATCASQYQVKSGDTLTKIANAYNLTLTELANANSLKYPYTIYVGESLCIPKPGSGTTSPTPVPATNSNFTATVSGDQLTINVKNFVKNTIFFVRVKPTTGNYSYIKIGMLTTNNNGVGKATITLPNNTLVKASQLSVCLKNFDNSKLTCTVSQKGGATTSTGISFSVTLSNGKLVFSGKGLPANRMYFVRVNPTVDRSPSGWDKIGDVRANSNGVLSQSLNLPNKYLDDNLLHVCLKDVVTDALTCRIIYP
jgi:LysM repeat protein